MASNRSYIMTSTQNLIDEFGVEVIIYDLFEVVYYDLIYETGLWYHTERRTLYGKMEQCILEILPMPYFRIQ